MASFFSVKRMIVKKIYISVTVTVLRNFYFQVLLVRIGIFKEA